MLSGLQHQTGNLTFADPITASAHPLSPSVRTRTDREEPGMWNVCPSEFRQQLPSI